MRIGILPCEDPCHLETLATCRNSTKSTGELGVLDGCQPTIRGVQVAPRRHDRQVREHPLGEECCGPLGGLADGVGDFEPDCWGGGSQKAETLLTSCLDLNQTS